MKGFRHMGAPALLAGALLLAAHGAASGQQPPAPSQAPAAQSQSAPAAPATEPHQRIHRPPDALLYIGWPNDGEVIRATRFKVWFGLRGFGVAPAGVAYPNAGHHHLIIDRDLPNMDEPIPNDRNHLHFGRGQTETIVELPPGKHTLQLLLGDAEHYPFDPPLVSQKITIYVRPGAEQLAGSSQ